MVKNKKRGITKFIIIGVVVLISIIGYFIYKNSNVVVASAITPKQEMVTLTVSAPGKVLSHEQATLSFSATGTVSELYVQEGDVVNKGQIIARLDTYSAYQNSKAAKDARDIALRNKDLFLKQYERDDKNEEYNIKVRTLDEQISQAEATYKAASGQLSNYYIKAPFDGTVVDIPVEKGQTVGATQNVVTVANLIDIYFEISLDQEDFGKVKADQFAEITLDAYPEKTFNSKVGVLPDYANSDGSFTVKLSLTGADTEKLIKLGMSGDSKIVIEEKQNVNVLMFDEYFVDEEKEDSYYVWTVDNESKLKKMPIEIGLEGDIYTEILTDLTNYSLILPETNKNLKLEDGLAVKIKE